MPSRTQAWQWTHHIQLSQSTRGLWGFFVLFFLNSRKLILHAQVKMCPVVINQDLACVELSSQMWVTQTNMKKITEHHNGRHSWSWAWALTNSRSWCNGERKRQRNERRAELWRHSEPTQTKVRVCERERDAPQWQTLVGERVTQHHTHSLILCTQWRSLCWDVHSKRQCLQICSTGMKTSFPAYIIMQNETLETHLPATLLKTMKDLNLAGLDGPECRI